LSGFVFIFSFFVIYLVAILVVFGEDCLDLQIRIPARLNHTRKIHSKVVDLSTQAYGVGCPKEVQDGHRPPALHAGHPWNSHKLFKPDKAVSGVDCPQAVEG
jgi:hypothetical protein